MHVLHLDLTIMLFVGVLIAQGSVSASVYIVNYTGHRGARVCETVEERTDMCCIDMNTTQGITACQTSALTGSCPVHAGLMSRCNWRTAVKASEASYRIEFGD